MSPYRVPAPQPPVQTRRRSLTDILGEWSVLPGPLTPIETGVLMCVTSLVMAGVLFIAGGVTAVCALFL